MAEWLSNQVGDIIDGRQRSRSASAKADGIVVTRHEKALKLAASPGQTDRQPVEKPINLAKRDQSGQVQNPETRRSLISMTPSSASLWAARLIDSTVVPSRSAMSRLGKVTDRTPVPSGSGW